VSTTPFRTLAERIRPYRAPVELDDTDIKLLLELAHDARAPQRKLAEALGMSSPAVADRMARLKSRGVVRGYRVDIDWAAIGYSTVTHLTVIASVGHDQNLVMEALSKVRGVEDIAVVTGGIDMLVRIRAKGFDDLRTILAEEIWTIEGIQRTENAIVLIDVEPPDVDVRRLESILKKTPEDSL
jgi:Lrp/AsnC family leucine-responsive transcriptional regulator